MLTLTQPPPTTTTQCAIDACLLQISCALFGAKKRKKRKDETHPGWTTRSSDPDSGPGEVSGLTMTFHSKLQTAPEGAAVTGSPSITAVGAGAAAPLS